MNFVSKPENKIVAQSDVFWIDHAEKVDQYKVRIASKELFPPAIAQLAANIPIYPHEYYAQVGPQGMNAKPITIPRRRARPRQIHPHGALSRLLQGRP